MSKDYRMSFIQEVERSLALRYDPDDVALISNVVIKALSDYEITERCTDLVPQDDSNERLIRRYAACMMVDGKSRSTIYTYSRTIRNFSDMIRKPFAEIGVYDIRFFLATEKERGIANATLETIRSRLSAFFQWLVDDEVIPKNPLSKVKPIKVPKEIRTAFTDVELDAIRSACKSVKERALIEFLVSTGVRVSELTSINIADVDFDNLAVHVVHGKGSKERMTYMTAVAAKHLLAYIRSRKETDSTMLFCNREGGAFSSKWIQKWVKQIGKRAVVDDVHPHRFRRTFATNLVNRGMNIQEVQKLLGHSSINTTLVYVATDDKKVRASYSQYSA